MSVLDHILRISAHWGELQAEFEEAFSKIEFPDLNEFGQDPFGLRPDLLPKAALPVHWLYKHYFRVQNYHIDRLPAEPCLVVSNHTGQIPLDGTMITAAVMSDAPHPRFLRAMVDHFVGTLPFIGSFFEKVGQVAGTPENCLYLLSRGYSVLVFPEGAKGITKPFHRAYELQNFGQGFLRLALQAGVPIVPVAVVGAEESLPSLGTLDVFSRVGGPPIPLLATPLPLPTRFHIHWGEPLRFDAAYDDDDEVISELVEQVRSTIRAMIEHGLADREGLF
ncbi:MAG: lysophospholipid acyltransferase family protein [Myxococcota bacterium]|nr:lysophospholipid acyltransferase family protein [Myxococcota bacterium]